jgi:flagellar protein FlaJ
MITFIFYTKQKPIDISIVLGGAVGFGIFVTFIMIYARYPDILSAKKADMIDKDLVFALKDLSLQISAGVNLYESLVNISRSDYGNTSHEFKKVVRDINSGISMPEAIERMALRNRSEYLKRTSWQIVNTLKSGSNIKKTLKRIISDLSAEQRDRIRNYSRELNIHVVCSCNSLNRKHNASDIIKLCRIWYNKKHVYLICCVMYYSPSDTYRIYKSQKTNIKRIT